MEIHEIQNRLLHLKDKLHSSILGEQINRLKILEVESNLNDIVNKLEQEFKEEAEYYERQI